MPPARPAASGDPVNHRTQARPLVPLLLLAFLCFSAARAPAAAPTPAPAELPTFTTETPSIEADDHLQWTIPFTVVNKFTVGMYLDSLFCTVEDLDPGETRTERVTTLDVSYVVTGNSASAGDTYAFTYVAPAVAEHARLTFRLVISRADKTRNTLTTVLEAMPGPVSRDHPSQFITVNGRRVEYLVLPAQGDTTSPAPGLLFVHGRGENARTMLRRGMRLAGLHYTVMLVSMPGYGLSEGPPDVVGPLTVQALGAALDQLEKTRRVDPKRVGAWGESSGGAGVTLLAMKRADLRATVAEAGFYDLWSVYRALPQSMREMVVKAAGTDSSSWRARSAVYDQGKPAAILILHGEKDPGVPVAQARGFAESLKARGVDVASRFFPNSGHELPLGEVMRTAVEFLDKRLGNE
jgi:dipeptidyl aminopeptidase/acylaminoacyl peptidase